MNTQIWKEDTENQLGAMRIGVCKYLLNEEFSTLWANDTFYTMCGYSEEEYHILFHDSATLFFQQTPKDFEKLKEIVEHAYRNKSQQYECFCRLPVKGGSCLRIHMTGTFAEEQIDGIPVVYVVYTDVEDMMRIRQNLEQEHERLNLALQMEMKTVSCIRLMYISNDMQSYMDQLLKEIGEFMHAERAYVFELQNGCMNNTYEWCSDGVESSMYSVRIWMLSCSQSGRILSSRGKMFPYRMWNVYRKAFHRPMRCCTYRIYTALRFLRSFRIIKASDLSVWIIRHLTICGISPCWKPSAIS